MFLLYVDFSHGRKSRSISRDQESIHVPLLVSILRMYKLMTFRRFSGSDPQAKRETNSTKRLVGVGYSNGEPLLCGVVRTRGGLSWARSAGFLSPTRRRPWLCYRASETPACAPGDIEYRAQGYAIISQCVFMC